MLLVVLTNDWHGWVWSKIWLEQGSMATEHGWFFWLFSALAYLELLTGTAQYMLLLIHSADEYRWRAAVMVMAAVVPWIGNILYLSGVVTLFDLTPFGFFHFSHRACLGVIFSRPF